MGGQKQVIEDSYENGSIFSITKVTCVFKHLGEKDRLKSCLKEKAQIGNLICCHSFLRFMELLPGTQGVFLQKGFCGKMATDRGETIT